MCCAAAVINNEISSFSVFLSFFNKIPGCYSRQADEFYERDDVLLDMSNFCAFLFYGFGMFILLNNLVFK